MAGPIVGSLRDELHRHDHARPRDAVPGERRRVRELRAAVRGPAVPADAAQHVHVRCGRGAAHHRASPSLWRSRSTRASSRFRTVYRVGFYAPVVTSIVAIAIVWRFILQPDGLLNGFLALLGIQGPDWLQDPAWALPSLIMMAVWRNIGTLMVIFLAALQGVPREHHEAAMVDGANAWQRFRNITIPAMRPTLLFAAVITGIGYLQFFEEPYVMTQGGPLDATLSTAMYTYDQFGFGNYAYASAASYVLFLAIVVLSLIQFRLLGRKD